MKRILSFLFLMVVACAFCNAQRVYKITGRISGLPDGELFLIAENGISIDTLAQTKSMSGNFLFAGQAPGVTMAHIMTPKQEFVASMMLENTEFSVLAQGLVAGGGRSQRLLAQFNELDTEMVRERKRMEQLYLEAEKKKDTRKMEAIDLKFQKFLSDAQARELELLQANADTYVAAYVVASTMRDVGVEKLTIRYDLLGKNAQATSFGKSIASQIKRFRQIEVGSVAPDFKLTKLDNGITSLYETKARIKIVNFWASWGIPCREENVNLLRIYEQYHLKGLEIISVSMDDNKQAWQKAVIEDGMGEWKHMSDLKGQFSDVMSLYCLQNIPYTFLLDENNVIVAKGLRGEALKKKVEELLKKK